MSRKIMIMLVAAAALAVGPTANAVAFSDCVAHVVTRPVVMNRDAVTAIPTGPTTAIFR